MSSAYELDVRRIAHEAIESDTSVGVTRGVYAVHGAAWMVGALMVGVANPPGPLVLAFFAATLVWRVYLNRERMANVSGAYSAGVTTAAILCSVVPFVSTMTALCMLFWPPAKVVEPQAVHCDG